MPGDKKEPQSYGSQSDWVTGNTGQSPNGPKNEPPAEHQDFYEPTRTAEGGGGGEISPRQHAENAAQPTAPKTDDEGAVPRVTAKESGAKRGSFFKDRDYE